MPKKLRKGRRTRSGAAGPPNSIWEHGLTPAGLEIARRYRDGDPSALAEMNLRSEDAELMLRYLDRADELAAGILSTGQAPR